MYHASVVVEVSKEVIGDRWFSDSGEVQPGTFQASPLRVLHFLTDILFLLPASSHRTSICSHLAHIVLPVWLYPSRVLMNWPGQRDVEVRLRITSTIRAVSDITACAAL